MPEYKLALIGFGNVGRALAQLLLDKSDDMRLRHDIRWRVVGIATRSRGMAINPAGLDLPTAIRLSEESHSFEAIHIGHPIDDTIEFIQRCDADLLFEISSLNPESGQPALDYIRTALNNGMHVATANKGPVVHAYRELRDLAEHQGRRFFFESTVMDGTPIFSLFRDTLPVSNVLKLRGVLNSTTNLVLTRMAAGIPYADALAYAQEIGIAETDPTNDVEGWDAAVKVAALVTVLMDHPLKPQDVDRQGITDLSLEEVHAAERAGTPIKLLCTAERLPTGGVAASVHPTRLPTSDPLAHLTATSSAVAFTLDTLKQIVITGIDPGPRQTAYGLLADFINIVRG